MIISFGPQNANASNDLGEALAEMTCGYGPDDADAWTRLDAEGYVEAGRPTWEPRAMAGQCPHCGELAQGRGLTCGAAACAEWLADVLPLAEAWRLMEMRLQHQQPEPVNVGQVWLVVASAAFGGAGLFAIVWPLSVWALARLLG